MREACRLMKPGRPEAQSSGRIGGVGNLGKLCSRFAESEEKTDHPISRKSYIDCEA